MGYRFDTIFDKGTKARYINRSLEWLALRPQLLDGVETDKELIDRVVQFARELCEADDENGEKLGLI